MQIQELTTPRLLLRPLRETDRAPLMEFFNDAEAMRFHFNELPAESYADNWLRRQFGRYQNEQGGLCAVELATTGELIGQCGLLYQWVDHVPKWEIGYHFIRRFWGQGFATEAAIACRDLAFEQEIAETLISIIHPDNLPSQAVAQRNGMTFWKNATFKGNPAMVFRVRRADWELRNGEAG